MVNKQLIDYIRNAKSKGYSSQQLSNYLRQQGYPENDILEAMKLADSKINPKTSIPKPPKKNNLRIAYISEFATLLLVALIFIPYGDSILLVIAFITWLITGYAIQDDAVHRGLSKTHCCWSLIRLPGLIVYHILFAKKFSDRTNSD